ncbi:MAG: hypothetical protein GY727_12220 [Gammaproteobacteria bacterium]|nr:hypothetical protein [Gammaproteobacteria bacterium]MCP4091554.1 hypothetical protein [Gammaproteobacteria bacterium]MCP4275548.1 hypothetical protein [Gammaproteobacteria bacterium]MCP4929386.1 hypothetical protein [Gammaproteobacteria bacterium]
MDDDFIKWLFGCITAIFGGGLWVGKVQGRVSAHDDELAEVDDQLRAFQETRDTVLTLATHREHDRRKLEEIHAAVTTRTLCQRRQDYEQHQE